MKLIRIPILLAYAGFIFYQSSRQWQGEAPFPQADKLYHLIVYFGFGGIMLWAFRATRLRDFEHIKLCSIITAALYGLSDEIHQLYVPTRQFSLADLSFDIIGSALGIMLAAKIAAYLLRTKHAQGI